MKTGRLALGLDIGTTTLSAAVIDLETGIAVKTYTVRNESALPGNAPYEKIQDARWILAEAEQLAAFLAEEYSPAAIGITGQMHGVLYVDASGNPVSPLYTWQDERAGQEAACGVSYCDEIEQKTRQKIFPGYGWATHYFNLRNGLVPGDAVTLCTIMDAAAMRLTGNSRPLLHPSNAAGLGLFKGDGFRMEELCALGVEAAFVPAAAAQEAPTGYYRGIPVSCAIGDNQASVFGALAAEEKSVLVNFGTGSQVSLVTDEKAEIDGLETRPYLFGKFLLSGAALCGGKAYALTEGFFRQYAGALGTEGEQYALMQRLAQEAYEHTPALQVRPLFCGTRQDASIRGSITGISEENFTPGHLILGVLRGMAGELWDMYEKMPRQGRSMLAASGNGVRKNPVLQRILKDCFQMPLLLPRHREEAAFGAALYAAVISGAVSFAEAKQCIGYEGAQS